MAAPPKTAKRRGAPIAGRRSAKTKPAKTTTRPRAKSQAHASGPAKKPAQKPTRERRTAAGPRSAGRIDSILAAQLEAIAHGLEQIGDLRAEISELRAVIEELSLNVTALIETIFEQTAVDQGEEPAEANDLVIIETDGDPEQD